MMNFYRAGGILCLLPATYRLLCGLFSGRVFFRVLPIAGCICLMLFGLPDARSQSPERQEAVAGGKEEIKPLRVGDKVPNDFWTRRHTLFTDNGIGETDLEAYKGKPLILDFWASWCGTCLQNFPKLDKFKEIFGEEINFLLVNSDPRDSVSTKIQNSLYDQVTNEYKTSTPSLIFDSYLKQLFPHRALPHYIWIDHTNRVRAISTFDFVNEEQIRIFIGRSKGVR